MISSPQLVALLSFFIYVIENIFSTSCCHVPFCLHGNVPIILCETEFVQTDQSESEIMVVNHCLINITFEVRIFLFGFWKLQFGSVKISQKKCVFISKTAQLYKTIFYLLLGDISNCLKPCYFSAAFLCCVNRFFMQALALNLFICSPFLLKFEYL